MSSVRNPCWLMICSGIILPIGSMVLLYMVTFTINIPQMLAYIAYMDPMGYNVEYYEGGIPINQPV